MQCSQVRVVALGCTADLFKSPEAQNYLATYPDFLQVLVQCMRVCHSPPPPQLATPAVCSALHLCFLCFGCRMAKQLLCHNAAVIMQGSAVMQELVNNIILHDISMMNSVFELVPAWCQSASSLRMDFCAACANTLHCCQHQTGAMHHSYCKSCAS